MSRLLSCLVLCLGLIPLAAPARAADYCTEAWVIRNMIFDRLGHCFSSTAGQMLFDNSDCTTRNATPMGADAETVRLIRQGEEFNGCSIDTSKPPTAAMRETLARFSPFIHLPAPDEVGGYACWGYRGAPFPVLAGAHPDAPVFGTAQTGQSVVSLYMGRPGGWWFGEITTGMDGPTVLMGWFQGVDLSDANCDQVAG